MHTGEWHNGSMQGVGTLTSPIAWCVRQDLRVCTYVCVSVYVSVCASMCVVSTNE